MPLILLGFIVILGIVIYALVRYANSDDGETDTRPVRERYSHAFPPVKKDSDAGSSDDARHAGDGHTMYFPTDAEIEKRKRNIH